jgi:hypothetical protein
MLSFFASLLLSLAFFHQKLTVGENGIRKRYATSDPVADFGPRMKTGFC